MEKWADFGVVRVKYCEGHTAIDGVEIRPDLGEKFGDTQKASRDGVVTAIESGTSFVTIFSRDGKLFKGEDVHVIKVQSRKYLRTDRNAIEADNLGSLPEFS